MLITHPQMGNIDKLLKFLLNRLEVETMAPPRTSERTLALGSKHSPEFSCLPLKLNIGNFIEAIEQGADTLMMAGGRGPCRFGYYAEIETRILADAGYNFNMVTIEPPGMGIGKFIGPIQRVSRKSARQILRALKESFPIAAAFDEVEREVLRHRCYELVLGDTTKAYKRAMAILSNIIRPEEVKEALEAALAEVANVPKDLDRQVLKVGIVGELFILLEPFANFDIEEWLGNRGVYVERSVYITDWLGPDKSNAVGGVPEHEIDKLASPYLGHFVGGEGLQTIGNAINYKNTGFDGVVHLFPFTCMPETIAKAILPRVSADLDLPIIHFTIDEQTGKAGMATRLEAFLDLLASRRRRADKMADGRCQMAEKA